MIKVRDLSFSYNGHDEALKDINLDIKKGSWVSILGHNGSGKSTLSKLLVGLLTPAKGFIEIDGMLLNDDNLLDIRRKIGIVFQNPDNQFVGVTVKHDIAFGLENQRIPHKEMVEKIDYYANLVGMQDFLSKEPHQLSGGQKQRVAIAGALAMEQDILILDEATSMLDPEGTKDIIDLIKRLNKDYGKTIITITHDLSFATKSDELIVLRSGELIVKGTPKEVFKEEEILKSSHLELPFELGIYNEAVKDEKISKKDCGSVMGIQFKDVGYQYKGIKVNYDALSGVNLNIAEADEFIAIIGHTGSGKSTLVQHMNALLLPTEGQVVVLGQTLPPKKKEKINHLRQKVGLVFQFPEYQLFEESIIKDIMFGPLNFKSSEAQALEKAKKAAIIVGIPSELYEQSPFRISGGQMRRVAIAGILAMEPKVLVLDEPTRGLDPKGRNDLMKVFKDLHEIEHKSIVLISHDMDVVSEYAKRVIVMDEGQIVFDGKKEDLFEHPDFESFHLELPTPLKILKHLEKEIGLPYQPKYDFKSLLAYLKEANYE